MAYFRQRFKNRVFAALVDFVVNEGQKQNLTKKDLAERMGKDPAQLNRLLSAPSNMTLETISDVLLGLGAEADPPRITKFDTYERNHNYVAPLYARIIGNEGKPPIGYCHPPSDLNNRDHNINAAPINMTNDKASEVNRKLQAA